MKRYVSVLIVSLPIFFGSTASLAAGPSSHFSAASTHSAQAISEASIAGVKVVSGVIATPLIAVGKVGEASGIVGDELWEAASFGEPLEITDEIIMSTTPPDQAMQEKDIQ